MNANERKWFERNEQHKSEFVRDLTFWRESRISTRIRILYAIILGLERFPISRHDEF